MGIRGLLLGDLYLLPSPLLQNVPWGAVVTATENREIT